MEYVVLPNTDLKVSRVCLGTMQFAGSVEGGRKDVTWGDIDQPTVTATVVAALNAGINFSTPLRRMAKAVRRSARSARRSPSAVGAPRR